MERIVGKERVRKEGVVEGNEKEGAMGVSLRRVAKVLVERLQVHFLPWSRGKPSPPARLPDSKIAVRLILVSGMPCGGL